ncbi:MAG: hypothetical protein IKH67_00985, partial [Lachnospiraceae bacterium]|nr:hypothetical protein [Lachnospiraceae bacterium]
METIKGYVQKIIYRNADNGYCVLSIEENGCENICVGNFRYVDEGEYLELDGEFVFHPSYGEQFKVSNYRNIVPQDIVSIERFLGSGAIKGIGEVTHDANLKPYQVTGSSLDACYGFLQVVKRAATA